MFWWMTARSNNGCAKQARGDFPIQSNDAQPAKMPPKKPPVDDRRAS
jgi:hypothetical protein